MPYRSGTMKGDSPVDPDMIILLTHMVIHIRINQPEDERLIPHKGLVMGLGIANGLFIAAAVGQLKPQMADGPILILLLLNKFYPKIRNPHGQSIIKSNPPFFR